MDLDDFVGAEVGVAVAATAAVLSPRVRGVLRRGAVYGIAGALIAGGAVSSGARGIGRGARQAAGSAGGAVQGAASRAGGAVQGAASRVGGGAQTTGSGS